MGQNCSLVLRKFKIVFMKTLQTLLIMESLNSSVDLLQRKGLKLKFTFSIIFLIFLVHLLFLFLVYLGLAVLLVLLQMLATSYFTA